MPAALREELVDVLLETPTFRLERIVSTGHATPVGRWYDQARDEWVLLLRGSAGLRFEGDAEAISVDQSLTGRLLGFGSLTLTGTGGVREVFHRVVDPLEFRRRIQGQTA